MPLRRPPRRLLKDNARRERHDGPLRRAVATGRVCPGLKHREMERDVVPVGRAVGEQTAGQSGNENDGVDDTRTQHLTVKLHTHTSYTTSCA